MVEGKEATTRATPHRRIFIRAALVGVVAGGVLVAAACERNVNSAHPAVTQSQEVVQTANMLDTDWGSVPGAQKNEDGLEVAPIHAQIVEQDGGGGQENPPVDVDSFLEVPQGFAVSMTMDTIPGATTQSYGELPIIQDEFRVERPSVQVAIKDAGNLAVRVWDGHATDNVADQKPVVDQTFPIENSSAQTAITMTHKDDSLLFTVNGHDAGSVPDHNIFDKGTLWFGVEADSTPWTLSRLAVDSTGSDSVRLVDATKTTVDQNEQGLQHLATAKRPGFKIGTAAALYPAMGDPLYQSILLGGNFGQMTLENASKWQFTEPQQGNFTFQQMDTLVTMARTHGMTVNGHAAGAFGEALPKWVQDLPTETDADKAQVKQILIDHIKAEVGHFKGRVSTWDIVNEPLADYDDFDADASATLRDNIWYKAMGEDYIRVALEAAHEADPDAQLSINDYGLEGGGERLDAMIALIQKLKVEGVPIDSVGLESHVYDFNEDKINPKTLQSVIRQLGQAGVTAHISELDVDDSRGQSRQAQQYADVLKTCLAEQNCTSYTVWGFDDAYDMWQDDSHGLQYGSDLLWNRQGKPTPAVDKLRDVLSR